MILPLLRFMMIIWLSCGSMNALALSQASTVEISTDKIQLEFDLIGAVPVSWKTCVPSCTIDKSSPRRPLIFNFADDAHKQLEISVANDVELARQLNQLRYSFSKQENEQWYLLNFESEPIDKDVYLKKTYRVSKQRYEILFGLQFMGPKAAAFTKSRAFGVKLTTSKGFEHGPLSGFANSYERVRAILSADNEVQELRESNSPEIKNTWIEASWLGIRNRFWTLLLQPEKPPTTLAVRNSIAGHPGLSLNNSSTESLQTLKNHFQ